MSSDQRTFLHPDFLLYSKQAQILYHKYAKNLPVIDYHNHLPPDEIAADKKFQNLSQIWLKGDHYKWRAMRAFGVEEAFITGGATDEEKFLEWAKVVPYTVRNPLFHWTAMELADPFGVTKYLNEQSAPQIYQHCKELLQQDDFSTRSLLHHFKVEMVGTTDDPTDDLKYHQQLTSENRFKVLPSFRPDKVLAINTGANWRSYIQKLEQASGVVIKDIASLLQALESRVDYFHQHGCRVSDHGLNHLPLATTFSITLEREFSNFISDPSSHSFSHPDSFAGFILLQLCTMYHKRGWVQQFHLGALRNNNTRRLQELGADTGYDSIGDFHQAETLSRFFNELEKENSLTKTILYNLNPADNEVFATMAGNFNDGTSRGKMQYGSSWWFLDQKEGMEKQLNALSNMGLISTFVGMLTDSRSFLSYSRHEYFRRILCNLFGSEMQQGIIPDDEKWIGEIVQNICYYNAKNYFDF